MIGRRIRLAALIAVAAVIMPWPHPGRTLECRAVVWEVPHELLAYFYALRLESSWHRAQPRTKPELERHLHLYSTKAIVPAESCWGHNQRLRPGETMLQYQILWHAPLDVIYDSTGRIVSIFTSYE